MSNVDTLFQLFLSSIKEDKRLWKNEYIVSEIGEKLFDLTRGSYKTASFNYVMTSLFSRQKSQNYFILKNKNLHSEFTRLANDANRNNSSWKTVYGTEKVRINPYYLINLFPYSKGDSIRILPMSNKDLTFRDKTTAEVQIWFQHTLPSELYQFKTGMNIERGSLVLFQWNSHLIASAVLEEVIKYSSPTQNGYTGSYRFFPSSVATFIPINLQEVQQSGIHLNKFSNAKRIINTLYFYNMMCLLLSKEITFTSLGKLEDQEAMERIELPHRDPEDEDIPVQRIRINNMKSNQKWVRSKSIVKKALTASDYTCEYDALHQNFIFKVTNKNYVEAHHLIPMEFQDEFEYSLDVTANIVMLCPVCHKRIHHESITQSKEIIKKLYDQRIGRMKQCGISIPLKKLLLYYR